jgi:hypothetical protein
VLILSAVKSQRPSLAFCTLALGVFLWGVHFDHSLHHHYDSAYRVAHHEHRSSSERRKFERLTGYPDGRPGYIIDHVIPLACNGPDDVSNMQWETVSAAKAKDRWERKECRIIDGRSEGCCTVP